MQNLISDHKTKDKAVKSGRKNSKEGKRELYIHGKDGKIDSQGSGPYHKVYSMSWTSHKNRLKSARDSAKIYLYSPRSIEAGCEAGQTASAVLIGG